MRQELKVHEIVRADEPEDYPHRKRKPSPSGVMDDGRSDKSIKHALSLKLASASGQYVLDPFTILSVGQRDEEPFRRSKNIHWCSVNLTRFATYVCQNAEAGQPGCESARDPVGDS